MKVLPPLPSSASRSNVCVAAVALERERPFRRLVVEVTERLDGALLSGPTQRYLFEQLPDLHVPCSNPNCRHGGVFLTPTIREVLRDKEDEQLLMEMCPGQVRLAGKKVARFKCYGMFFIRIRLE